MPLFVLRKNLRLDCKSMADYNIYSGKLKYIIKNTVFVAFDIEITVFFH